MDNQDSVILVIRGKKFKTSKAKLSEFSDYFRAMFSGNYVEKEQNEVNIDMIDPNIMGIILHYMKIGLIDLSDHSLSVIEDLAMAANFLQVTELIKQIRYYLDTHLSVSNWVTIMTLAESATFMEEEQLAAAHGLLSFKCMKPKYIPTIHKLFWYLSHPYLDAQSEFEVFKFGHKWVMCNGSGGDGLLLILCCLDYKRLTVQDLKKMVDLLGENYTNSLAEKVIECLKEYADEGREFLIPYLTKHKLKICKKYTERVYEEVANLIRSTIKRMHFYTPAVPIWVMKDNKPELVPHHLYTYEKETGFQKWLEVADTNLWGWSVTAWGLTKVIVVCGEQGRGSGVFMQDVKVYDVLRKEWIHHGVHLPPCRHPGLAVLDDSLYILGGVGAYRVVLDSAKVYDLNQRTFRKIGSLPDAIQSPAACVHNREVYVCGQKNIYRYENEENCWRIFVNTAIRPNCMVSFKGFIYCTQNYFGHFYKLKPRDKEKLEIVTQFIGSPAELCHLGDRVMVFSRKTCGSEEINAVEEYTEEHEFGDRPNILWAQNQSELKVNDVAGSCVLVTNMPPVNVEISEFHRRYLDRFHEE